MTLSTRKVPLHVRLQRLVYNEKGNMNGLLGAAATRCMILQAMKENNLMTARRIDPTIIHLIGNEKWH